MRDQRLRWSRASRLGSAYGVISFGGIQGVPFFSNRPNLSVCLSVCPELGLATFLQPARRLASAPAFFECEWVTSCCTSVPHLGSPPGGAPPAQGNTRLCSYPSVLPPSVVPFGCAAFSLPRLVSLPLRVGCMYHQRVECESVVPPPGGAPPAQGSTHLCSYPSVLPPSACVTWLCRDGRYKVS